MIKELLLLHLHVAKMPIHSAQRDAGYVLEYYKNISLLQRVLVFLLVQLQGLLCRGEISIEHLTPTLP